MQDDKQKNRVPSFEGPDGMDSPYLYEMFCQSGKKQWKLKPWQGAVLFVCLLVLFQLLGSLLFLAMGIWANGVAEMVFFFGGSWLAARLLKLDWKEVVPLRKPGVSGIFGTILIWFGAYQCMTAMSLVLALLFPRAYTSVGDTMNSFVTGLPFAGAVVVIALIPAVSEEVFHRGLLQYSLQPLKKKWLIIFCMGIYFGIFHLSLIRFLPMMFLGMVIAWLRQETGSVLYGMVFHFLNNFFALAVTFLSRNASAGVSADLSGGIPMYLLGYYFLMAAAGPFLMFLGGWLVKRGERKRKIPLFEGRQKAVTVMTTVTIVLAATGVVLFIIGIFPYF